jgi:hypothetical protein
MKPVLLLAVALLCAYTSASTFPDKVVPPSSSKEQNFPRTEEIQLVVSQSERAFESYKQSISFEEALDSSKQNSFGVEQDKELLKAGQKLTSALTKNPDGFHGVGGLLLLSTLDDASRNAALCTASAFSEMAKVKDVSQGYQLLAVIQSCTDVSQQLYIVSQNVHALLVREMESQALLNEQAVEALHTCSAAIQNQKK